MLENQLRRRAHGNLDDGEAQEAMPKMIEKARETRDGRRGTGDEGRETSQERPSGTREFYSWAGVRPWPKQKGAGSDESARVNKETKKAKEKPAVGG